MVNAIMQRHINDLLAELGDSVSAIAAELERREIRGLPGAPSACPIARYLKTRDVPVTFVSTLRATVRGEDYDMPDPAGYFVAAFDDDPDSFAGVAEVSGEW